MQTPTTAAAVGFIANRSGLTYPQFRTVCRMFLDRAGTNPVGGVDTLHVGEGSAADADFARVARWMRPAPRVVVHTCTVPVAEPPGLAVQVEPAVGPAERNRAIVDGCELLLACPREGAEDPRSGTWSTVRYARAAKRTVFVVYPDGLVGIGGRPSYLVVDRDTLEPVHVFLRKRPDPEGHELPVEKVMFEPLGTNGPVFDADGPVRPVLGRAPQCPGWFREFPSKKALLRAGYEPVGPHHVGGTWDEYTGGRKRSAENARWTVTPGPVETPPPGTLRKRPAVKQRPEPLPLD